MHIVKATSVSSLSSVVVGWRGPGGPGALCGGVFERPREPLTICIFLLLWELRVWVGELAHLRGKVQDFLVPQASAGDLCVGAVSRDTCCVLGHVGFAFSPKV